MPLTTYDEVRPWARAIKDQVLTRRMPKWPAAHGYGAFANDPSLTPAEMAIVAAWADGGMPKGPPDPAGPAIRGGPGEARRRYSTSVVLPASAADVTVRASLRWIGGWDFEPGDPLITSATFAAADGTPIGAWVAGDAPVQLPAHAGIRIVSPIRITLQRRAAADYEQAPAPKRSVLRLLPHAAAPKRRVWIERTACGAPRVGRAADLLAVRPLLPDGASARVWLERPGAPQLIVGWFRHVEAAYPRTYWLDRAVDLPLESRLQADGPCAMEVTLAAR